MNPAFALILTALAAGYGMKRFGAMPRDAADTVNRFVIYVCLPAVVLRLLPTLTSKAGLAVLVVTPWLLVGIGFVLITIVARRAGWSRGVAGSLLLCAPLGNTSFLGFPMLTALLGADAIRYAVLYDQLGSFLIVATYGLVVVARFSGENDPSFRTICLRVATFPPFAALLVALIPFRHSAGLDFILKGLGDPLVPLAMFAVGLKLELRLPTEGAAFAFGLFVKMVLSPLVALLVAHVLGATGIAARVAILEAAMPPMITAGALAAFAGLAPELSAALVGYGVLGSLVTVPLWARLLS